MRTDGTCTCMFYRGILWIHIIHAIKREREIEREREREREREPPCVSLVARTPDKAIIGVRVIILPSA